MKTFSILTALFFVATLTMAQSPLQMVAHVSTYNDISTVNNPVSSQLAIKQLSEYLVDNIQLPASVEDHGFVGSLMLEVTLASDGAIIQTEIVKKSNSKFMDQAAVNALSSLNKLDIQGVQYHGVNRIRLPLKIKIER